ncbi:MAG: ferrous iron transport protein B, partial [Bacteroidota bacterium]|nr:ferrous iron transport protein B [Bacteroidota bacterium]
MNLSELQNGDKGVIVKVRGHGAFRKRILEMGFVKGKEVEVIKNAPLRDPIEYSVMGYHVSLRKSEAFSIEVITIEEAKSHINKSNYEGVFNGELLRKKAIEKRKTINIALVGNPNCGKTTLFNIASGSREHVGNYSGVTVDSKKAIFKQDGYTFDITDLPGTYSLTAFSPEELFVRKYIIGEVPDIIINVVDASNLERNLYLTTQLIDMDLRVVIALNMFDELEKKGDNFNFDALGKMLGIPFVPTVSSKGKGISNLFKTVIDVYENREPSIRHIHINYGKIVELAIKEIQEEIRKNKKISDKYSPRFLAVKLLEKDKSAHFSISESNNYESIKEQAQHHIGVIEKILKESSETVITDAKYGFIAGALKETYKEGAVKRRRKTEIIDTFMTHRLFGFPIFLTFMFLMFFSTFQLGQYPMSWIESGISLLGLQVDNLMPDGPLKDLIVDGIIGGVGGVIIFLPNILILFLFISFMEDTGYMSRAAFIMDKLMHRIGLHGRSFIPLIMGFGCNVPAIMATRTIENRNDRLLTILINPFISCSARLPVYILIIGAFFPTYPSLMLFLIYTIGILIAIFVAKIFKRTLFKTDEVPFVMELPPYRQPTLKATFRHMWEKGFQYLKKMGGVILVGSILIWALGYYPQKVEYSKNYENLIQQKEQQKEQIGLIATNTEHTVKIDQLSEEINMLQLEQDMEHQEKSYIGRIGKAVEPIMRPLGFDWKTSISLIVGITAKEIVVSTLGVLYQAEISDGAGSASLQSKL